MSSRVHAALLALLVLSAAASQVAAAAPPSAGASSVAADGDGGTLITIDLDRGGDAHWTVVTNVSIATGEDTRAFEELATAFEQGRTEGRTISAVTRASRIASNRTGREMTITGVERSSAVRGDTGSLILRFTWTNFARSSGEGIRVDDSFNTTSGTWLSELDASQTLIVRPPQGHRVDEASPTGYQLTEGSLRWDGPARFEPGDLSISFQPVDNGGTITTQSPTTTTTAGPPPEESNELSWALLLLGVLAGAAVLAYVLRGGTPDRPSPGPDAGAGDRGAAGAATGTGTEADDSGDGDAIDPGLLSDEERIERLLERNGGRMKQADIVNETGWSNAKVSQLLSSMDEEGRIDKLRIGRENLISFPDEDISDIDE